MIRTSTNGHHPLADTKLRSRRYSLSNAMLLTFRKRTPLLRGHEYLLGDRRVQDNSPVSEQGALERLSLTLRGLTSKTANGNPFDVRPRNVKLNLSLIKNITNDRVWVLMVLSHTDLGRVVRKPVNVNPCLNVN